jgi:hypothetical protein
MLSKYVEIRPKERQLLSDKTQLALANRDKLKIDKKAERFLFQMEDLLSCDSCRMLSRKQLSWLVALLERNERRASHQGRQ